MKKKKNNGMVGGSAEPNGGVPAGKLLVDDLPYDPGQDVSVASFCRRRGIPFALPEVRIVNVATAAQLDELCRAPKEVLVPAGVQVARITGRELTPEQFDRVDSILRKALPPMKVIKEGEPPVHDLLDPTYLAEKNKYVRQARAMALALGYQCIAEDERVKNPLALRHIESLTKAIDGMFTEEVQVILWNAVMGENRLWERVASF